MSAASILIVLLVAFVIARLYRSTKLWWIFISTILAGLLVGMLSKEMVDSKSTTSETQLISVTEDVNLGCMQSLVVFAESNATTCLTGVAGNIPKYTENLRDITLISNTVANGRDSPDIEDDS